MKPLLILKTGTTMPAVAGRFGDFDAWFRSALHEHLGEQLPLQVIDATRAATLPPAGDFIGAIITGSPAMVSHREPWSEKAAVWLKQAYDGGLPLFGVCYGHQLLAHALGGRVGPNPYGRHIGTARVELTATGRADPLLDALAAQPLVQVTHMERVLEAPAGATVLATLAADPHHALRYGPAAWGVQFHPEFTAAIMRSYVQQRRPQIEQEGLDAAAITAAIVEAPAARGLLAAFARLCRQRLADNRQPGSGSQDGGGAEAAA